MGQNYIEGSCGSTDMEKFHFDFSTAIISHSNFPLVITDLAYRVTKQPYGHRGHASDLLEIEKMRLVDELRRRCRTEATPFSVIFNETIVGYVRRSISKFLLKLKEIQ